MYQVLMARSFQSFMLKILRQLNLNHPVHSQNKPVCATDVGKLWNKLDVSVESAEDIALSRKKLHFYKM